MEQQLSRDEKYKFSRTPIREASNGKGQGDGKNRVME